MITETPVKPVFTTEENAPYLNLSETLQSVAETRLRKEEKAKAAKEKREANKKR